jgi:hypothetical protein
VQGLALAPAQGLALAQVQASERETASGLALVQGPELVRAQGPVPALARGLGLEPAPEPDPEPDPPRASAQAWWARPLGAASLSPCCPHCPRRHKPSRPPGP